MGGLLSQLAGRVVEAALEAELTEHLRHPPGGRPQGPNELYGTEIGRDTISRIADALLEDVAAWRSRPPDAVYPIVYFDAMRVLRPGGGSRSVGGPRLAYGTEGQRVRILLGAS